MQKLLIEKFPHYINPQSVFESLPKGSRFLLESTLANEQNRWALLGCEPKSIFYSKEGRSFLDNKELMGNPFEIFSALLLQLEKRENSYDLPFLGGWIGCVSYEAARFLEKVPTHDSDFPFDLAFYYVDSFYVFDLWNKEFYFVSPAEKTCSTLLNPNSVSLGSVRWNMSPDWNEDRYIQAIQKLQELIREGHTYQVNLSQRFVLENKVEPFEIYKALSQISPVPFAGFFEWGEHAIISGSPERLFEVRKNKMRTRPIAGTRRCGNEEETARFIKELSTDPKEHAEHCMLVDLARNDLGRICEAGSVEVTQFMDIVSYSTVIHTESEIEGTLLKKQSFFEIMKALFPGGTITGVPKIRTMEIIHEFEPCARGIYTGALGYVSACGHTDFNIMIRSILCTQNKAITHAGGGITCKSDPKREYKETLNKARAQLEAIRSANENSDA